MDGAIGEGGTGSLGHLLDHHVETRKLCLIYEWQRGLHPGPYTLPHQATPKVSLKANPNCCGEKRRRSKLRGSRLELDAADRESLLLDPFLNGDCVIGVNANDRIRR